MDKAAAAGRVVRRLLSDLVLRILAHLDDAELKFKEQESVSTWTWSLDDPDDPDDEVGSSREDDGEEETGDDADANDLAETQEERLA